MQIETTSWGRLVRGKSGMRGQARGRWGMPAGRLAARVRRLTLASCVLALVLVAAPWIEAGVAAPNAAPDPHPSAKTYAPAPAPDPYQAPSQPESSVETPPVTSASTGASTRTTTGSQTAPQERAAPTRASTPTRTQKTRTQQKKKTDSPAKTVAAPRRTVSVKVAVATSADGGPLLLGGLGLVALALASGSLLFLVNRAGSLEARS